MPISFPSLSKHLFPFNKILTHSCSACHNYKLFPPLVSACYNHLSTNLDIPPHCSNTMPPPCKMRVRYGEEALNLEADVGYGDDKIAICRASGNDVLDIRFKRTLRVPDNHEASDLPPCIGTFPLLKTSDYQRSLPTEISKKGGVFFPMYRKLTFKKSGWI
jgi:hypothetical protein